MNRIESSVEIFRSGIACSQAVLVAYSQLVGLDPSQAMKLSAGFAGGMRRAETCGAVTGAYMVLGMHYCGDDCNAATGRKKIYSMVREFTNRFEQRNKTTICKELLAYDISTKEGIKSAQSNNLFKTKCVKMVQDAAEILEEMLNEN